MLRGSAVAAVALLVLGGLPTLAQQGTDVREDNRRWLLERNPDYDPAETVTVHSNGSTRTERADAALELALDRAGRTSLESPVTNSERNTVSRPHGDLWVLGTGGYDFVGDIWVVGTGNVDCGRTTTYAEASASARLDPQLWLYPGRVGDNQGSAADDWTAISWTMMDVHWGSGKINYGGVSDFFCVEGEGFELLFPFIDGYTTAEDLPPTDVPLQGVAR